MKKINSYLTYEIIVILCLYLNIAHTHQIIMKFARIHHVLYPTSHICFFLFEGFLIYFASYIIPKFKKTLLLVLYLSSTLVLWINIGYSRYFDTYLPLSLYGEYNNLNGLLPNIIDAIEYEDLFFLLTCSVVIIAFIFSRKKNEGKYKYLTLYSLVILIIFSSILYLSWINKIKNFSAEHYKELGDQRTIGNFIADHWETLKNNNPKASYHYYGIGLNLFLSIMQKISKSNHFEFAAEEENHIKEQLNTTPYYLKNSQTKNLIFLIVESLCSYPINKTFGNIEITPNINKLLSNSYYNPNMKCETQLGESSDGQFIYLTGLLPLRNSVTINEISTDSITTYVSLAKDKNTQVHSKMIIPTREYTWSQKTMCQKYGIEKLYSRESYKKKCNEEWLNDEQLFDLAEETDRIIKSPFISIVLTLSMHSPYTKSIETYGIKYPSGFSPELKNYLNNVHYTDKHLGLYLASLKKYEWYNNSTIVIVPDHKPNGPKLNYKDTHLFTNLPLIIYNPSSDFSHYSTNQGISQASVFPTILDLLQIESTWRGIDQSIFMPDSVRQTKYEKSRIQNKERISNYLLNKYL